VRVIAPAETHAALERGRADLLEAGSIESLSVEAGDAIECVVELASPST